MEQTNNCYSNVSEAALKLREHLNSTSRWSEVEISPSTETDETSLSKANQNLPYVSYAYEKLEVEALRQCRARQKKRAKGLVDERVF